MAPALAALLIVISAPSGTLTLSDVSRVYARRTPINDATTMDLETTPRIGTRLAWPTTVLDLDYSPRFAWVDVLGSDPSPTLLLQSAALRFAWRGERVALSLLQTGAIGDQDFTRLVGGLPGLEPVPATPGEMMMAPQLDLLPGAEVVRVAAEETTANLRYAWSRRWSSELQAAFGFSGGANDVAQQFLPQQRRAQLDLSLAFARSASDDLTTAWRGAQIRTSNGYDHWLVSLVESWSLRWSESSGAAIGAGVALQDTTGPAGLQSTDAVPVATASIRHALLLQRHVQARVQWNLGYGPDVNVLAGTLQSRLFASAQAGLTIERSSLTMNLGAAQSFPRDAPDATELISADVAFEHELADWLSFQLGGQITRQGFASVASAPSSAGSLWLLYAGLSGRVPEQHF